MIIFQMGSLFFLATSHSSYCMYYPVWYLAFGLSKPTQKKKRKLYVNRALPQESKGEPVKHGGSNNVLMV